MFTWRTVLELMCLYCSRISGKTRETTRRERIWSAVSGFASAACSSRRCGTRTDWSCSVQNRHHAGRERQMMFKLTGSERSRKNRIMVPLWLRWWRRRVRVSVRLSAGWRWRRGGQTKNRGATNSCGGPWWCHNPIVFKMTTFLVFRQNKSTKHK